MMTDKQAPLGAKENGIKVPKALRDIALEMGMEESPVQPGLFYKEVRDVQGNSRGILSWDFRPDKNDKHPEGVLSIMDGVDVTTELDDRKQLEKIPLAANIMRRRDEYLAEARKKMRMAAGEVEDPVESVKTAGAQAVQAAKQEHQAYSDVPMTTAQSQMPIKKDFMTQIGSGSNATPKELAFEIGVGDKKQRYATNRGLWYAFYALGLKLKICRVEHIHWSWTRSEGDPLSGVALCKSMITVDDGTPEGQYYEAYAKASVEDVKLDDVKKRLDEMAETRAEDRCLRKITAGGWRVPNASNMTQGQQAILQDIKSCEQCSAEELAEYAGDV